MKFETVEDYISHFVRLINIEREEEMRRHWEEIKRLTGKKRERLGRAILNLRGKFIGRGLGGAYLVKFSRKDMPKNELMVGDVVIVSAGKVTPKNPQATVYEKGSRYIVLSFSKTPPKFVYGKNVRVDLYANDITFQRMLEAVNSIKREEYLRLRGIILGRANLEIHEEQVNFENTRLNEFQRRAVRRSIGSELFLIHGPPGTGKTTTLAEGIVQMVRRGFKVLATADSNVAVDNLVEKLAHKVNVVRIGHPARISKSIIEHTLDYIVSRDIEYRKAMELWERIDGMREEQSRYTKPTPQWRRGMGDDEIVYLANASRSYRGVPVEVMKGMAQWIKIQRRIDEYVKRAKKMEERAIIRVLDNADVICTTNSTAGGEMLRDLKFDFVVIDEATQAVEPSCLIPMLKGTRILMAGDHKQLPPTVMSYDAKALQLTLFERLIKIYPQASITLRIQYRMNEKIMEFPSNMFYRGLLEAHRTVKDRTIADVGIDPSRISEMRDICNPEEVIIFVDLETEEEQRRGSTSYQNPGEARCVTRIVNCLLKIGLKEKHIGIITPYDDQVDLLKSIIPNEDLEIKSVDGFQGREKEVIVISFVRANDRGELGFLTDLRRLNVAITRAKRKLIIVGNSKTLRAHPVYDSLIDYIEHRGKVLKMKDDC
ncbi:IGHMBP2 family helicase [Aciduliprofundum sp. MAR08-339]|uniref:IGHMBP2 family helicase n=1 Tax=Aciduliprofundum sp. (strain MAR08-339) TaxID=673860 RepID=UPI00064F21A9